MTIDTSILPGVVCTDETAKYIAEQGWEDPVAKIVAMTRDLFPTAPNVEIRIDDDPEIADLRFVVFTVRSKDLTMEQMVQGYKQWSYRFFECLSPPYHYNFVLNLDPIR